MDFKKEKKSRIQVDNALADKYPHDLQMYSIHPDVPVTLCEFEELAIERLKVLRILETATLKGSKTFDDWKKVVTDELNRQGLKLYRKLFTSSGIDSTDDKARQEGYEARQRDHVSHFILRFAYCQSEEYRRWFISRELELFKFRWSFLSPDGKKMFLKLGNFNFAPLDSDTIRNINETSGGFLKPGLDYYCVKWTDVLDLVRLRKVFLDRGRTYISATDLISVLGAQFRSNLSHTLVMMSHKLSKIQEDERLKRLVKNLHHAYVGKSYVANEGNKCITIQSIEPLSKTSFPLCMKQMYNAVKTHHHLRHWGRQQFGLFLKGIGLSLEDALVFWRMEFTKKPEIDIDSFEKKYAYGVRYNYGKEGKRTNYTPYSCAKIIASAPGPGECHGCPFKSNGVQNLKQTLATHHFAEAEVNEVINFVNMHQYQLACAKYFEVTHKLPILSGVNHPNQYFEESQKLLGGKSDVQVPKNVQKSVMSSVDNMPTTSEDVMMDDSELEGMDLDQLPGVC